MQWLTRGSPPRVAQLLGLPSSPGLALVLPLLLGAVPVGLGATALLVHRYAGRSALVEPGARAGCGVRASIWEGEYLPRLWVVDPGLLWSQDTRVATLADRDPDDLPTARLAILLGQKALSEDTDLTDYGLASGEPWLQLVFAIGSVARGETVDFGIMFGASISMQTVTDVVGAGRQLAATPGGKRTLLVLGAGFVLLILGVLVLWQLHEPSRRWIDDKARLGIHALASGGKVAIGAYGTVSVSRMHGEVDLRASVVAEARSPSLTQRAARTLAAAEAPMSTRDLAAVVWATSASLLRPCSGRGRCWRACRPSSRCPPITGSSAGARFRSRHARSSPSQARRCSPVRALA